MSLPPGTNCVDCCACPDATLRWETRSASGSKCGAVEMPGFVSFPPKIFRELIFVDMVMSALGPPEIGVCDPEGSGSDGYIGYINGTLSYPFDCSPSYCDGVLAFDFVRFGGSRTFSTEVDLSYLWGSDRRFGSAIVGIVCSGTGVCGGEYAVGGTVGSVTPTYSSNILAEYTFPIGGGGTVNGTITLGNEYLTADLITNTIAELPADYPLTTAGASRNLSDDETSFSVREGKYYWRFPVPNAGYGRRYVIRWVERFQPEDEEGAPTDTPRCEEWDGTVPEGYNPDDPETWPELGPYDAPIPDTDGLFNVGQYTDPEDPDTYVAGGYTATCTGTCL